MAATSSSSSSASSSSSLAAPPPATPGPSPAKVRRGLALVFASGKEDKTKPPSKSVSVVTPPQVPGSADPRLKSAIATVAATAAAPNPPLTAARAEVKGPYDCNRILMGFATAGKKVRHWTELKMDLVDTMNKSTNSFFGVMTEYYSEEATRDCFSVRLFWNPDFRPAEAWKDENGLYPVQFIAPVMTFSSFQLYPAGNNVEACPDIPDKLRQSVWKKMAYQAAADGYAYDEAFIDANDPRKRDRAYCDFIFNFGNKLDQWVALHILQNPTINTTHKGRALERQTLREQLDYLLRSHNPFATLRKENSSSGGGGAVKKTVHIPEEYRKKPGGGPKPAPSSSASSSSSSSSIVNAFNGPKSVHTEGRQENTEQLWFKRSAFLSMNDKDNAKRTAVIQTASHPFHKKALANSYKPWDLPYFKLVREEGGRIVGRNIPLEERPFQTCVIVDRDGHDIRKCNQSETERYRNILVAPVMMADFYLDATIGKEVATFGCTRRLHALLEVAPRAKRQRPPIGARSFGEISSEDIEKDDNLKDGAEWMEEQQRAEKVKMEEMAATAAAAAEETRFLQDNVAAFSYDDEKRGQLEPSTDVVDPRQSDAHIGQLASATGGPPPLSPASSTMSNADGVGEGDEDGDGLGTANVSDAGLSPESIRQKQRAAGAPTSMQQMHRDFDQFGAAMSTAAAASVTSAPVPKANAHRPRPTAVVAPPPTAPKPAVVVTAAGTGAAAVTTTGPPAATNSVKRRLTDAAAPAPKRGKPNPAGANTPATGAVHPNLPRPSEMPPSATVFNPTPAASIATATEF